ncbi:DegV family protein, partial [Chloroflexota bacterium]
MQPVGIITDTSACLPQDLIHKYSIEVVPLQFVINGSAYLDGVDISPAQFYAMLPSLSKL